MERIQPQRTDGLAAPYFNGCREGELRLQHCAACGHWQFYPRPFCTACGADAPAWEVASGQGTIASFSVVRRALSDAYAAPYTVALIDLVEGPRMMSAIVDCDPAAVRVGAPVSVCFEQWSQDLSLPVFRLDEKGGEK
ncbi:Zn-ribbon domain-containing OB-fold protein [Pseudohaliea rubra]|uniref:DNA-binding protein n=1 Tax=Pseudohaliea rubra DSM 19751 TaxID=1265313 RepID=A0A095XZB9_9GAMM|nr:OB-fold domain-containing protein [Pseudohaliea rubra]KGE05081.1 hypothetical protein HRUBRA_00283 [Pseudohaliea rubra DSM 19751]